MADTAYQLDSGRMAELLELLFRIFDIRITFFDMQAYELGYFPVKAPSRFCCELRRSPAFDRKCVACDRRHLEMARTSRKPVVYHCHAGLLEGIVPVYDQQGRYLGAVVFGQLRDRQGSGCPDGYRRLRHLYDELPEYDIKQVRDIGRLISFLGEYIMGSEMVKYRDKTWSQVLALYIDDHLHERIPQQVLGNLIGRSVSFISHHFPQEFGMSVRQYVLGRKMEAARKLLEQGSQVQAAAARFGFYDEFHFSKAYKKYWGCPPVTHRK